MDSLPNTCDLSIAMTTTDTANDMVAPPSMPPKESDPLLMDQVPANTMEDIEPPAEDDPPMLQRGESDEHSNLHCSFSLQLQCTMANTDLTFVNTLNDSDSAVAAAETASDEQITNQLTSTTTSTLNNADDDAQKDTPVMDKQPEHNVTIQNRNDYANEQPSQVLIGDTQMDLYMEDECADDDECDSEDSDSMTNEETSSFMAGTLNIPPVEKESSQTFHFGDSPEDIIPPLTCASEELTTVVNKEKEGLKGEKKLKEADIVEQDIELMLTEKNQDIEIVEDQTMELRESVIFDDPSIEVILYSTDTHSSDSDESYSKTQQKKRKLPLEQQTPNKKQKTLIINGPKSSSKKSFSRQLLDIQNQAKEEALEELHTSSKKLKGIHDASDSKDLSSSGSETERRSTIVRSRKDDIKRLGRRRRKMRHTQSSQSTVTQQDTQEECPTPNRYSRTPSKSTKKKLMSLFDGIEFATTKLTRPEKDQLLDAMQEYGGTLLETKDLFSDMLESRKIIMLAQECCTTPGYLAALAIDIPLLKLSWFYECISAQQIVLPRDTHQLPCFIDKTVDPPVQTSQELPRTIEDFTSSYCVSNQVVNRIFYRKKVLVSSSPAQPKIRDFIGLLRLCGAIIVNNKPVSRINFIFDEERAQYETVDRESGARVISTEFIRDSIKIYDLEEMDGTSLPVPPQEPKPKKSTQNESTVARVLDFNKDAATKTSSVDSSITPIGSKHLLNHTTFSAVKINRRFESSLQVGEYYHIIQSNGAHYDAKIEKIYCTSESSPVVALFELQRIESYPIQCRVIAPATTNIPADSILYFVSLSVKETTLREFKKLSSFVEQQTYLIVSE